MQTCRFVVALAGIQDCVVRVMLRFPLRIQTNVSKRPDPTHIMGFPTDQQRQTK